MTEPTTDGYTQDNHPDANVRATWKTLNACDEAVGMAISWLGIESQLTQKVFDARSVATAAFLEACAAQGAPTV